MFWSKLAFPFSAAPAAAPAAASLAVPVIRESTDTLRAGKLLGQGAFGKVYSGEFRTDATKAWQSPVAFKIFSGHMDAATRALAVSELQVLARIRHEGALQLHAIVEMNNGGLAAVLEYCAGGDLSKRIKNTSAPFAMAEQLAIAQQTAAALAHLHSIGITHGDIKPANVLLDGAGNAKLADFGLALFKDGHGAAAAAGAAVGAAVGGAGAVAASPVLGLTHGVFGTILYMAPELLPITEASLVARRSTASDVFAYGIMLWQLMTRREPYTDAGALRMLSAAGTSSAATIKTCAAMRVYLERGCRPSFDDDVIDRSTPEYFKRIVQACWATDPYARPTAAAVLAGLRAGRWDTAIPSPGRGVSIEALLAREAEVARRRAAEELAAARARAAEEEDARRRAEAEARARAEREAEERRRALAAAVAAAEEERRLAHIRAEAEARRHRAVHVLPAGWHVADDDDDEDEDEAEEEEEEEDEEGEEEDLAFVPGLGLVRVAGGGGPRVLMVRRAVAAPPPVFVRVARPAERHVVLLRGYR